MTELVQRIIKSDEAKNMRQMVTAGFYDHSELALWLFEAIGREYDDMRKWLRELAYEAFPQTCTWSIGLWEFLYQIVPDDGLGLETRRKRLLSKVVRRPSINPAGLENIISILTGCPEVRVVENTRPYTFRVEITLTGAHTNLDLVEPYVKRVKPSHLSFEVARITNTHKDLGKFTHAQINQYTHRFLMNSTFKQGS